MYKFAHNCIIGSIPIWYQRLHTDCTHIPLTNKNNLYAVVLFQVFLSNTNNFYTVIWYEVFQCNTNNSHRVLWYHVFLSNTNNLHTVIYQVFLIKIIGTQRYDMKYFRLI